MSGGERRLRVATVLHFHPLLSLSLSFFLPGMIPLHSPSRGMQWVWPGLLHRLQVTVSVSVCQLRVLSVVRFVQVRWLIGLCGCLTVPRGVGVRVVVAAFARLWLAVGDDWGFGVNWRLLVIFR